MADSLTVIGIVANIVQLVDFSTKILARLNDFQSTLGEIPKAFRHIKAELPVLQETLRQTKDKIDDGAVEESTRTALLPAVQGCKIQVEALDSLLAETLPVAGDSRLKKTTKALWSMTQDSKVESITKSLRGYIATLTFYHAATSSTLQPMKDTKLVEIRRWLSAPDPSINYWKAIKLRHPDTGLWFLESEAYSKWKRNGSSFLWLTFFFTRGKQPTSQQPGLRRRQESSQAHSRRYVDPVISGGPYLRIQLQHLHQPWMLSYVSILGLRRNDSSAWISALHQAHDGGGDKGEAWSGVRVPEHIFIFYDIDIIASREIAQLGAVASTGEHFSTFIKTSTRKNSSPVLKKLPATIYSLAAVTPRKAMIDLREWVSSVVNERPNSRATEADVVMIAHNGSCHDHVILLKTMMSWGLNPPIWRFSDTLPIYKIVVQPDEGAKLSELAHTYAPWFMHMEHDAFSDAAALSAVVTVGITSWQVACYAFSTPCSDFIRFVGLNTFAVGNPLPFSGLGLDMS
ncbi:hypothetical protein V500_04145 [Pseudogymnoascus sp. VKM F-4518 (FW-2643)]|nr:hypothetical protein V500_04145 [Pseudogymnoascus sp. VKM F-4518 (FW-2643)]